MGDKWVDLIHFPSSSIICIKKASCQVRDITGKLAVVTCRDLKPLRLSPVVCLFLCTPLVRHSSRNIRWIFLFNTEGNIQLFRVGFYKAFRETTYFFFLLKLQWKLQSFGHLSGILHENTTESICWYVPGSLSKWLSRSPWRCCHWSCHCIENSEADWSFQVLAVWCWRSRHFQIINCYKPLSWISADVACRVFWIRAYRFPQAAVCSGVHCHLQPSSTRCSWADLVQCFGVELQLVNWVSTARCSKHYAAACSAAVSFFRDFHISTSVLLQVRTTLLFLSKIKSAFPFAVTEWFGFFFPSW